MSKKHEAHGQKKKLTKKEAQLLSQVLEKRMRKYSKK